MKHTILMKLFAAVLAVVTLMSVANAAFAYEQEKVTETSRVLAEYEQPEREEMETEIIEEVSEEQPASTESVEEQEEAEEEMEEEKPERDAGEFLAFADRYAPHNYQRRKYYRDR